MAGWLYDFPSTTNLCHALERLERRGYKCENIDGNFLKVEEGHGTESDVYGAIRDLGAFQLTENGEEDGNEEG